MKKYRKLLIQILFVVAVLIFWECYAIYRDIMVFPRLGTILKTLFEDMFVSDVRPILKYLGKSSLLIAEGLGIGIIFSLYLLWVVYCQQYL